MDATRHLEKDPVCEMMVDPRANYAEYRGVGYAFCSQQCRERFTAGPGLYVGRRGLPAPKQRGVAVIKRRRMVLGSPLTPARFAELTGVLQSMMGITALRPVDYADERMCDALRPEGGTPMTIGVEALEVTYDLLQVTAEQIERELSELDVALSDKRRVAGTTRARGEALGGRTQSSSRPPCPVPPD